MDIVKHPREVSYEGLLKLALLFLICIITFAILVFSIKTIFPDHNYCFGFCMWKPIMVNNVMPCKKSEFKPLTYKHIIKINPKRKDVVGNKKEFKKLVKKATEQERFDKKS